MKRMLNQTGLLCLMLMMIFTQTGFTPIQQTPPPDPQNLITHITQVDTSNFPKVVVYVSVTDPNGEPVAVNPNKIVIRENGDKMKLEGVNGAGDAGPLATMLVMDISGSMNHGGKLNAAKEAAKAYVDQARFDDKIGLVTFNTKIEYAEPLTKDRREVNDAIHLLKAQDDTAMYDALAFAIDLLEPEEGRKAIIVLTDGLDNRSKLSPQEVLQLIGPQGLSISVIGLGDPTQSTGNITSLDEPALKALAAQAGGAYGYANDTDSLKSLYEKYGRALHSEYMVTYTSPAKLRDGVNRALSASLDETSGGVLGSIESAFKYNPGGIVPEVVKPASWLLFAGLILLLVLLLFVPWLFRLFRARGRGDAERGKKGTIKLHSQSSAAKSKIKLKG